MIKRYRSPNYKGSRKMAYRAFNLHKAQSKFRNIEFNFTFEQWDQWWLNHGIDKNIKIEYSSKDRPCMCRYKDQGPYDINNVYYGTTSKNISDAVRIVKPGSKIKSMFRYGNETYSSLDFMEKFPQIKREDLKYFADNKYEYYKATEFKHLRVEYLVKWPPGKRIKYQGLNQWFEIKKEAARSFNIGIDTYNTRLKNGIYQAIKVAPSLDKFIKENSRYPDPLTEELFLKLKM